MKRFVLLVAALSLAAFAFAAGQGDAKSAAPAAPVQISWLTWETAQLTPDLYGKLIAGFEAANPGIKVKRDVFPAGDREQYMKTLYASNLMPDIAMGGVYDLSKTEGALLPVPKDITDLFDEAALTVINGKVNYVPTVKQLAGNVFYNKDVFAKYGLKPPATWDDFVNICKTLQSNGVVPVLGGGTDKPFLSGLMLHNPMLSAWLYEMDKDYANKFASGAWHWNDPAIIAIVQKWTDLIAKGYYHKNSYSFAYDQYQQAFIDQQAAMVVDGIWAAATYDVGKTVFKVGYFLLPTPKQAKHYPVQYSDEFAVAGKSKNPDAAFKFVKFFFTDEATYRTYLSIGGLYATKKPVLYTMPALMTEVIDSVKDKTPVLAFMRSPNQPAGFPQLFQRLGQDLLAGADVTKSMNDLEAKYRELQAAQKK